MATKDWYGTRVRALSDDFEDASLASNKSDNRRHLRAVREAENVTQSAYEEGRREARAEQKAAERARQRKTSARKRKSTTRKVAARAKRPVKAGTARAIRQVEAPIVEGVTSTVRISVLTFGVVALYLFLNSATQVAGALGGVSRALDWLRAPNTTIPYVQKQG